MKKFLQRLKYRQLTSAWRLAAFLIAATALSVWVWSVVDQVVSNALLSSLTIVGVDLLIAIVVGLLLTLILTRFVRLPSLFMWSWLSSAILLFTMSPGATRLGWYGLALSLLVLVPAAGVLLVKVVDCVSINKAKTSVITAFGGVVILIAAISTFMFWPGNGQTTHITEHTVPQMNLQDPSAAGEFSIKTLTYGSEGEKQPVEFGSQATIRTPTVDASNIIKGWNQTRTDQWGYGVENLPLNARVWMPEQEGKFPLILIAHGNNSLKEFSDRGFDYLGELLASRGYIVASVDQNFLNTSVLDRSGGLGDVNAARGWLLLEHLKQWQQFADEPNTELYGKVDMERIGLIGHSRGGEAVAIASHFNTLTEYPENPAVKFDYNFAITSIIALAPSDGQYLPNGQKIELSNVNYLVLQGTHDADVNSFSGLNQYTRTSLSEDNFKSLLYIHRANHDQFNTTWGRYDIGQGIAKHFINTNALLEPEQQQKIAQVYVSAFLETTMHDREEYRELFKDYRTASQWLPQAGYISQYADASLESAGLEDQSEFIKLPLRGESDVDAVELSLENGDSQLELPLSQAMIANKTHLTIDMVGSETDIAATITLRGDNGQASSVELDDIMPLATELNGQYLKAPWLHAAKLSEPIPQTYSIPLSQFGSVDTFDRITLDFRGEQGTVFVSSIGLSH